jgi:hypothetical protein
MMSLFALAPHTCNLSGAIRRHKNVSVPESQARWYGLPLVNGFNFEWSMKTMRETLRDYVTNR